MLQLAEQWPGDVGILAIPFLNVVSVAVRCLLCGSYSFYVAVGGSSALFVQFLIWWICKYLYCRYARK